MSKDKPATDENADEAVEKIMRKAVAKMKAPADVNSCSVMGEEFEVDKKGEVAVPAAYVDHLAQHGFTVVPK